MNSQVTIRSFQKAEADAVVALWRACGLVVQWNDPLADVARKLRVQPELFLVARAEDALVGSVMAGYEGHRGWLNYLAVAPAWRRRGLARELVAEAERRLRALGCPKINLQVRSANREVIAFYEAIGFAVEDVVSMGKRLA